MPTIRWKMEPVRDGIRVVRLKAWSQFFDYIREKTLEYPYYIWRGQRDAKWPLRASLDREIGDLRHTTAGVEAAVRHLYAFRRAARGRRGPFPAKLDDENELWALGQHHGLATPLLDWTESAFVALYFAFAEEATSSTGERAVWALYEGERHGTEAPEVFSNRHEWPTPSRQEWPSATLPYWPNPKRPEGENRLREGISFIRPTQDENARLVSQSGLFTRAPWGETIDGFVRKKYKGTSDHIVLVKLHIPEAGRDDCLRTLNRMNINHLSLFPDLAGSAQHCNRSLRIYNY
jgi:FRG domain